MLKERDNGTKVQQKKRAYLNLHRKMNDAVTIIVGAGAALDFDHKGIFPSVKNITDELLKLEHPEVLLEKKLLSL